MENKEPFGEFDRLRRQVENLLKPLQEQMDLINKSLARSLAPKLDLSKFDLPKIEVPRFDLPKIEVPKFDLERLMPNYLAAIDSFSRISRAFELSYLKQWEELSRRITESIRLPEIDWERLRDIWKWGLPTNWIDLGREQELTELLDLMRETGWCLVWAPRAEIIKILLDESDEKTRVVRFLDAREAIVEDVRAVLRHIESQLLESNVTACRKALDAFAGGHPEAAQALAAADMSSLINGEPFSLSFGAARAEFEAGDPMKLPWRSFRLFVVLGMVAQSLQPFFVEKGDPVPGQFSRHASAHTVDPLQYREENALAALLLLAAFLRESDLLLKARE